MNKDMFYQDEDVFDKCLMRNQASSAAQFGAVEKILIRGEETCIIDNGHICTDWYGPGAGKTLTLS